MGAYGRTLGKIATFQIFFKLEQALAGQMTKYPRKIFYAVLIFTRDLLEGGSILTRFFS